MHIHVLMLLRNFGLIPIKFGFFTNFKSYSKSNYQEGTSIQCNYALLMLFLSQFYSSLSALAIICSKVDSSVSNT